MLEQQTHLLDEEPDSPLGYQETLQYSQSVRRRVVRHFTRGGIPGDVKEVGVVLKALKDMDTSALEERKNIIGEGNADSARSVAESMRQFIGLQKNQNPFERIEGDLYEGIVPTVDSVRLGHFETVPGETEIGVIVEPANDFMKRMEAAKKEDE